MIEKLTLSKETSLSRLAQESIRMVSDYLGLAAEFSSSNGRYGNGDLKGADRVLDICRHEKATEYHNLPGGADLYSREQFSEHGLELHFLQAELLPYQQSDPPFKPALSILDLIMFNDIASAKRLVAGIST